MSHAVCSVASSVSRPFALAVLVPLFAAITAAILLGLLGVFVVWLCIVAVLITAIVARDVVRRVLRRLTPSPIGTLQRRAVGIPGR
jgi:membrane protein implicated in regulation of membrane protease activity